MKARYKTYTVQKYSADHGAYLGHCCCTDYEKAEQIARALVADGWPRARVLGGCRFAFIFEARAAGAQDPA